MENSEKTDYNNDNQLQQSPSPEKRRKNSGNSGTRRTIDGGLFNLSGFLSVKIPPKEQNQYFIEKFSDPTLDISVRDDYFILLPNHNDPVSHFSLDIGGSLIKMVYYEPVGASFETSMLFFFVKINNLCFFFHIFFFLVMNQFQEKIFPKPQ